MLRERLAASAGRLWRDSTTLVPLVRADHALTAVLARAAGSGLLVLGLEAAGAALDREELGLSALAARDGSSRARRISRVLLLANDGAERFYRAADRVTRRHAARLLTCRLDVPAAALGVAVLGRTAGVKAVHVQHKAVVAEVLRALAGAADRR